MADTARAHRRGLDGTGYPHGRTAGGIALETRIVTTSDIAGAITAQRPYRDPMSLPAAVATMERDHGIDLQGFASMRCGVLCQGLGFDSIDTAQPTPDLPHRAAA